MRLPRHISFRLDRNTGNGFYSCRARDSPKFEHQMRDFFCLNVGKSGNIRLSGKCESTRRTLSVVSFQIRLKCALLVCLSLLLETEEEFGRAIEKKNAGCGIFYKNLCSNRRSKSRMESDNLEEPLVFNYTIASSYHLGDLFLSFFLFFLQKTCFNGLHLQAVQRRLQEMRVRMAEDLCQRIVSAEAK